MKPANDEAEIQKKYPKDARGTIILKDMPMKMANKTSEDKDAINELNGKTEKVEVFGRLKSDITTGREAIYARSYYDH